MIRAYNYALLILFALLQKNTLAQPIRIGEKLPIATFYNILNHSSDSLNMGDYKGKLILLDFWGFNCISCLRSFPGIDSLQKQFRDRLQVILVNIDSKAETSSFFSKRKKIMMPGLPLITGDTTLQKWFPHTGVPFQVWIDGRGRVTHITDGKYLTSENIEKYLAGKKLDIPSPEKNTYETSLFKPGVESSLKYFSYIANCIDRGSFHINGLENNATAINTYYCVSIKDLYQIAYNESENDGNFKYREPGRTILKVKDKYKYEYPADAGMTDDWMVNNAYYYHMSFPSDNKTDKYRIMRQDLSRFFNLEAKIVNKKVRCLTLIRTSSIDRLKTKGGPSRHGSFMTDIRMEDSENSSAITNLPFKYFFFQN